MSNSHRLSCILECLSASHRLATELAESGGPAQALIDIGTARDHVASQTHVVFECIESAQGFINLANRRIMESTFPGGSPNMIARTIDNAVRNIRSAQITNTQLHNTVTDWANLFSSDDPQLGNILFQLAWNIAKVDSLIDSLRIECERLDFVESRRDR